MDSLEEEMQGIQQRIDKKEMMLVDDDNYTNSELRFEIETYTHNLRLSFAPQYGSDNIMSLGAERVENLIELLEYYLKKLKKLDASHKPIKYGDIDEQQRLDEELRSNKTSNPIKSGHDDAKEAV
jgi:hypothetical protein